MDTTDKFAVLPVVYSQSEPTPVTDPSTGFKFSAIQYKYDPPVNKGDLSMGFAFPKNLDKEEYIGYMVCLLFLPTSNIRWKCTDVDVFR